MVGLNTKEQLQKKYGLVEDDFFGEVNGHIVIMKSGVRKIKEKIKLHNITFEVTHYFVDSNNRGHAVVEATGDTKDCDSTYFHSEIGEASPENNDFPFPVSVATKRAESRLVLKVAGVDKVISEIELDTIKNAKKEITTDRIAKAQKKLKR